MNILRNVIFLSTIFCTVYFLQTCSEEPTKPPINNAADTTTHDFEWKIIPIGEYGTSLKDIAALSDTDIWICGEIWTKETDSRDSSGKRIPPCNFGKWNGTNLELFRLYWQICTTPDSMVSSVNALHIQARDKFWFSGSGSIIANWNTNQFEKWCIPFSISADADQIWEQSNDIFISGANGSIARKTGNIFNKIETGTDKNINDACTVNDTTICIASNWNSIVNNGTILLKVVNGKAIQLIDSTMRPGGHSIWFDGKGAYYIVGGWFQLWDGIKWKELNNISQSYLMSIRGIAWNDIFVVGHFGTIMHYNGNTWKLYKEVEPTRSLVFRKVAYIKDHVFIIGDDNKGQNYIYHGKRRR